MKQSHSYLNVIGKDSMILKASVPGHLSGEDKEDGMPKEKY